MSNYTYEADSELICTSRDPNDQPGSNLSQHLNCGFVNSQALGGGAQLDDLNHLLLAVRKCPDDQQSGCTDESHNGKNVLNPFKRDLYS